MNTNRVKLKKLIDDPERAVNTLNSYANHKNFAKSLTDLSLLTSNVGQLARITSTRDDAEGLITLLSLSIILQVSLSNSDLDSADFVKLKIYCQLVVDVAIVAPFNKREFEINHRGRFFKVELKDG